MFCETLQVYDCGGVNNVNNYVLFSNSPDSFLSMRYLEFTKTKTRAFKAVFANCKPFLVFSSKLRNI